MSKATKVTGDRLGIGVPRRLERARGGWIQTHLALCHAQQLCRGLQMPIQREGGARQKSTAGRIAVGEEQVRRERQIEGAVREGKVGQRRRDVAPIAPARVEVSGESRQRAQLAVRIGVQVDVGESRGVRAHATDRVLDIARASLDEDIERLLVQWVDPDHLHARSPALDHERARAGWTIQHTQTLQMVESDGEHRLVVRRHPAEELHRVEREEGWKGLVGHL